MAVGEATRGAQRSVARVEFVAVAIGLALVAALVYGDHVLRGGFMWDDWENAGTTHYGYEHGFLGPFDLRQAAYRPVLALLIPLPHLVFGVHPAFHLALGLACAVAAGAAFHALLRAAGASRSFALAAATLALVFPWASSTRLWATATLNMVAVALIAAAAAISLRQLATGDRRRVVLTAGMCAAAVLTYEAVVGIVALLPLLYRTRAPWRAALVRWRPEALATTKREGGPMAEHAVTIGRQGAALTARALEPWGAPPAIAVLAVAVVLVVAALVGRRRPASRPAVGAVGLGIAALAAAWAPFVPGEAKYVPSAPGIYDRVNVVAGFALAALVCALVACLRQLAPRGLAGTVLAAATVVIVGAGWVVHARAQVAAYDRAAAASRAELAAVARALPAPRHGSVIVVFQPRDSVAPGVPVFGHSWDLGAALKLRYRDPSLAGLPVAPNTTVHCGGVALVVADPGSAPSLAPYDSAVLVGAGGGRPTRVPDARGCRAAVAAFKSGRA